MARLSRPGWLWFGTFTFTTFTFSHNGGALYKSSCLYISECTCDRACVFRVLTAVGDWLSAGGLYITASCLASLATLILVLSVAVCLVRARVRRRRKTLTTTTKIELQETSSDEPVPPVRDPLLAGEICQLSDITLTDLDSEPVRYVVGHPPTAVVVVVSLFDPRVDLFMNNLSPLSSVFTRPQQTMSFN